MLRYFLDLKSDFIISDSLSDKYKGKYEQENEIISKAGRPVLKTGEAEIPLIALSDDYFVADNLPQTLVLQDYDFRNKYTSHDLFAGIPLFITYVKFQDDEIILVYNSREFRKFKKIVK